LIESRGYRASTVDVQVRNIPAPESMAESLQVKPGTPLVHLSRTRLANDAPVIQCEEHLPLALFEAKGVDPNEVKHIASLYSFLAERLDIEVITAHALVVPCLATGKLSKQLQVSRGHALLRLDQVVFASNFQPVCVSRNYHNPDIIQFRLIRRRAP
jgi:GntR family transcriptional regulator